MKDGQLVRLFGHHPVVSDGFAQWLTDEGVSVLFGAANRLWVVGCSPDGRIDVADHGFGTEVAAVAEATHDVLVATWQVWRFVDGLTPGTTTPEGHDRFLLPQTAVTVGDIGICDLFDGPDGIVFASSRLGCLATFDPRWSFRPIWAPPWQTALADEDRCHIGGVSRDHAGRTWVACAGVSDTPGGWRAAPIGGGCIIGTDGTVLARGLTLPRTLRAAGDALLVVNAGGAELLRVDLGSGETEVVVGSLPVCAGLAVYGHWAIVGLGAVAVADLPALGASAAADGLALVDLDTGRVAGSLRLEGRSQGVTSAIILAGSRWPDLAIPRGTKARSRVAIGVPEGL